MTEVFFQILIQIIFMKKNTQIRNTVEEKNVQDSGHFRERRDEIIFKQKKERAKKSRIQSF